MTDFAQDAARLASLDAQIKAMQAEVKNIKARYEDVPDDKYDAGDYILTVQRKRLFDPALAEAKLTKAEYASILLPKPDAARAKVLLPPKRYALVIKQSAPVITIKPVTDEE